MKKCDFDEVLKFIKSTFGKDKVPLHEPKFIGNEKKYLLEGEGGKRERIRKNN